MLPPPRLLYTVPVAVCLLVCSAALARADAGKLRAVPTAPKPLKVDAQLKDLARGLELTPVQGKAWTAKVITHRSTLHVGFQAKDEQITDGDLVEVSLYFPQAGPTGQWHAWRFGLAGLRGSPDELTPAFTRSLISARAAVREGGFVLEAAIPAAAFPRFPAKDPLVVELCISWDNPGPSDGGHPSARSSNCAGGTMKPGPVRLHDDFRKALDFKPPDTVAWLEPRADGWLGHGNLHYPAWVAAHEPLAAPQLRRMVTERPIDPHSVGINLPDALVLPDNRTVLSVLAGKDPYEVEGRCDADRELRLALYLVVGRTAQRVLEWPAATCALGRAAAIELDERGELTLGYTNGATVTFQWSRDRFERTQIGSR
jgi:hypothetical protein